jgi:hypothetical protein
VSDRVMRFGQTRAGQADPADGHPRTVAACERILTCGEHARMLLACLEWSRSGTCLTRCTVS